VSEHSPAARRYHRFDRCVLAEPPACEWLHEPALLSACPGVRARTSATDSTSICDRRLIPRSFASSDKGLRSAVIGPLRLYALKLARNRLFGLLCAGGNCCEI